jgi:hypothetical protein
MRVERVCNLPLLPARCSVLLAAMQHDHSVDLCTFREFTTIHNGWSVLLAWLRARLEPRIAQPRPLRICYPLLVAQLPHSGDASALAALEHVSVLVHPL